MNYKKVIRIKREKCKLTSASEVYTSCFIRICLLLTAYLSAGPPCCLVAQSSWLYRRRPTRAAQLEERIDLYRRDVQEKKIVRSKKNVSKEDADLLLKNDVEIKNLRNTILENLETKQIGNEVENLVNSI